jgi:hypothetical protein
MTSSSSSSLLQSLAIQWSIEDACAADRSYPYKAGVRLHFARQYGEWVGKRDDDGIAMAGALASGLVGPFNERQPLCWIRPAATSSLIPMDTLEALTEEARTSTLIRALMVDAATIEEEDVVDLLLGQGWRMWRTEEEGDENDLIYFPTALGLVYENLDQTENRTKLAQSVLLPMARAWLSNGGPALILAATAAATAPEKEFIVMAGHYLRLRCRLSRGENERTLEVLEWNTLMGGIMTMVEGRQLVWLLRCLQWTASALGLRVVQLAADDTNVYALLNEENGGDEIVREDEGEEVEGTNDNGSLPAQWVLAPVTWPVMLLTPPSRGRRPLRPTAVILSKEDAIRRADLRFFGATHAQWTAADLTRPAFLALASSHATIHPLAKLFGGGRATISAYERLWNGLVQEAGKKGKAQISILPTGLGGGRDSTQQPDATLVIHWRDDATATMTMTRDKKNDDDNENEKIFLGWVEKLDWSPAERADIIGKGVSFLSVDSYLLGYGMGQAPFGVAVADDKRSVLKVLAAASRFTRRLIVLSTAFLNDLGKEYALAEANGLVVTLDEEEDLEGGIPQPLALINPTIS